MSRLGSQAAHVVVAMAVTLAIAACSGASGVTPEPAAWSPGFEQVGPVLLRGRVVDANGVAVGGARLQLSVLDHAHSQVGQRVPAVFTRTYAAGIGGLFEIRLAPSADLVTFAKANGNYLNFDLIVIANDGSLIIPTGFTREISGLNWAGGIPVLQISPTGVTEMPAPIPAAT
jgi:hypothetical protein